MSGRFHRITPFLWFDTQAEEAANYYVSIFPDSRVLSVTRYTKESSSASGQPEGGVMTVSFELDAALRTAIDPVEFDDGNGAEVGAAHDEVGDQLAEAVADAGPGHGCRAPARIHAIDRQQT